MKSENPKQELRFVKVAGMENVYQPCAGVVEGDSKKHPCPDCHFCQFCSDSRCHACRGARNQAHRAVGRPARKLSLQEQILLYETINADSKDKKVDDSNHSRT
jgi:hypothetical protein